MEKYSLNDTVYFRITDAGNKIMRDKALEFHTRNPNIDIQFRFNRYLWDPRIKDFWYRQQLHAVFDMFGGDNLLGTELPIKDICFEDPTKDLKEE